MQNMMRIKGFPSLSFDRDRRASFTLFHGSSLLLLSPWSPPSSLTLASWKFPADWFSVNLLTAISSARGLLSSALLLVFRTIIIASPSEATNDPDAIKICRLVPIFHIVVKSMLWCCDILLQKVTPLFLLMIKVWCIHRLPLALLVKCECCIQELVIYLVMVRQ